MPKDKNQTAVARVAQKLRLEAMENAEGELIGSEDDMVERLGVSRPTLRQAAALVSQEQLLRVKRGVGGGYFATRPNSKAVSHIAAIYLRTHDASLDELFYAAEAMRIELARLTCRNRSPETAVLMQEFLDRDNERNKGEINYRTFLIGERDLGKTMGEASKNKVLSLFLEILYDFTSFLPPEEDIYIYRTERIKQYLTLRTRFAEAMLVGDEELAVLSAKRCSIISTQWMLEDRKAQKTHKPGRPSLGWMDEKVI